MLPGKPYRDPALYEAFIQIDLLKKTADEIQSLQDRYRNIYANCLPLVYKYLKEGQAPTKEAIIEELAKIDEAKYGKALSHEVYPWYADWTMGEYLEAAELYNGTTEEFIDHIGEWIRPRSISNEQYNKFQRIDNALSKHRGEELPAILEGEKRAVIENNHISLPENESALQAIKSRFPKEKRMDFSSKEKAEKTLREYIDYRINKNTCHNLLKRIFPEHQRKHGIIAESVELNCGYYHGYQLEYHQSSVLKEAFPEVLDENSSFSKENRILGSQKAVALPGSWGNIYADLPIDLFKGREGEIAFALIGIEEEMAIPYRSYRDLASTHLINPVGLGRDSFQKSEQSAEQVYQAKQGQRKAVLESACSFGDPWYDKARKTSGHTEALVYGKPTAIISCLGFEDVALEARRRYSAAKLISPEAPFFTYDPIRQTPLKHVSDQVIHQEAEILYHSRPRDRIYYDPDLA